LGDVLRQHLDGDRAVETGVAGFIDFAHAAGSEGREEFVRTELVSG